MTGWIGLWSDSATSLFVVTIGFENQVLWSIRHRLLKQPAWGTYSKWKYHCVFSPCKKDCGTNYIYGMGWAIEEEVLLSLLCLVISARFRDSCLGSPTTVDGSIPVIMK